MYFTVTDKFQTSIAILYSRTQVIGALLPTQKEDLPYLKRM